MSLGYFNYPMPVNEPVLNYAPGSAERALLQKTLAELKSSEIDIPQYIGGEEIRSGNKLALNPPHERAHVLGYYHEGEEKHVHDAIAAALKAKPGWETMS